MGIRITQLNHVAVHCRDVQHSCDFYGNVLGLQPMARPAFDFPGAWFRVGADQEVHLIGRAPTVDATPRERHFAFKVDDADATASHLRGCDVEFSGPNPRPDGARQIFLRDPDGHVVELFQEPR